MTIHHITTTCLLLSAAIAPAATVTIAIGDAGLPTQFGDGFSTTAANGLAAENGSMWGITNNSANRFGLKYDSYSNIAGATLPATIQAGTYVFSARVGNNGLGGAGFVGLNDISMSTSTSLGMVAGFFTTVVNANSGDRNDAQNTKNNMYTEWNGLASVSYTAPTVTLPAEDTFTTWTFTWEVAEGSPVIGTDPNFGVFTKTGNSGGNGFWDDSTLSFTPVPEPAAGLLGLLGLVSLLRRRR